MWVPDPENVWIGAVLLEDLKDEQLELELEDGRVRNNCMMFFTSFFLEIKLIPNAYVYDCLVIILFHRSLFWI